MNRFLTPFLTATFVALLALPAHATTISFGNYTLLPNTPNQTIPVLISGGNESNIVGADLFVLVGDGGPERVEFGLSPGTDAPGMEHLPGDVNMTTGTIFTAGNPTAMFDRFEGSGGSIPQLVGYEVTTQPGPVSDTAPNSVLAYLTFDTTGFTHANVPNPVPVYLDDTAIGGGDSTDFTLSTGSGQVEFDPTLVAGSISILPAPEPATLSLVVLGVIPILTWAARRRVATLPRHSS